MDSAGIGDSVDALILTLASMSFGAPNNSESSALMNVSICFLLGVAKQALAQLACGFFVDLSRLIFDASVS